MKFIFATDTHATGKGPASRTDSYVGAVKRKLMELAQTAKHLKAEAVIHGGDLFDKPVVSLQLMGEIADIIRSSKVPWYVVPGNHDLFGYNINSLPMTSLGMLEKAGVVTILDRRHGPLEFIGAYGRTLTFEGQEYHKDIDHRAPGLDYYVTSNADYRILVPHSMLLDKEYFPDVPYTKVEDAAAVTEADMILVGHFHDGFKEYFGKNSAGKPIFIRNPGSMLRDEGSVGNLKRIPKYITLEWDSVYNDVKTDVHPFKSAEEGTKIFDRSHITNKAQKDKYLQSFEQKLSDVAMDAVDVRTVLDKIIKASSVPSTIEQEAYKRLTDAEQILVDVGQSLSGYLEKPGNIHIKQIHIKGFQSHEDTAIVLDGGLNAIVGASDSGKSAVIRALRFALFNEPRGSDFIRQSDSKAECSVYFSDGSSITRSRTRTSAGTYMVRDSSGVETELKGFTNHIPVDIANTHQMPKLQLTKDKEASLNIGMQLEGPFLIGESPGTRAQIIGQLTGVELVDHALKELNKDILANTRDIKHKQGTVEELHAQIDSFRYLDDMKKGIDAAQKKIQHIELIEGRITELEELSDSIHETNHDIVMHERVLRALPDVQKAEGLIAKLEFQQVQYDTLAAIWAGIENADAEIEHYQSEFNAIPEDLMERYEKLDETYLRLGELESLKFQLTQDTHAIHECETYLSLTKVSPEEVETLACQEMDLKTMLSLHTELEENRKAIVKHRKFARQAALDEQEARTEYEEALAEAGTCPTCGQQIAHVHIQ